MKLIHSHLTGNPFVNNALYAFSQHKLLNEFHVSFAVFPQTILSDLGRFDFLKDINRRKFNYDIQPYTRIHPFYELGRLLMPKIGLRHLVSSRSGTFHIDNVVQQFDKAVARSLKNSKKHGVNAVYSYEDIALFTFREAKQLGLTCLYDLPIGYWRTARKLMANEKERWPEWFSTITGFEDSEEKLYQKDEELKLADRIFVASQFTARTLLDFPGVLAPIEIIPYGFPEVSSLRREYKAIKTRKRPLKLLFVGSLSQRKGIADLFSAVSRFNDHIQLTLVGQKPVSDNKALNTAVTKHIWYPSLANKEVITLMRSHDVLVFPSLFEGFGLVITEAMAQGTPVITTDRTAGLDLIDHGRNGWLIQAGSTEALQSVLEDLLYSPNLIAKNGYEAMETARSRPWKYYSQELADAVSKVI